MKVIIDDVQAYERVIHKILPSNIIESILKWGTHRGLIIEKRARGDEKAEKSELLSLQLFARGSNSSDIDDSSVGFESSVLGHHQANLLSKSADSVSFNVSVSGRPSSNDSNSRFPQISGSSGSDSSELFNDDGSLSSLSHSSSLQSFGGRSAFKFTSPIKVKDLRGEDRLYMPHVHQNGSVGTLPPASSQSHLVSAGLRKGKVKSLKKK